MKTFPRYLLIQVPGWIGAALILYAIWSWFGYAAWIGIALFLAFVGKDFLFYRFLKPAYEAKWNPGPVQFIGEHGIAVEAVAPAGYVRVRGELWMAEVVRGAAPVPADSRIRVQAVRGDKLIVMAEPVAPEPEDATGEAKS